MNNEVSDSSPATASDAVSASPADQLRALLDEPKPKDKTWQEDAGRAVAMLTVGFLNEADDLVALRSVALLGLAQSIGVKEARKRAIKLSRWAKAVPPPLTALREKNEQRAALTSLAKIPTPWTRTYTEQALADPFLPDEFASVFLKWARATYADNLGFIRDFYALRLAAAKSAERMAALLKDAAKLLKPSTPDAAKLAEGMALLVDALLRRAQPPDGDEKFMSSSVVALLNLLQDQATSVPAALLQPAFVRAIGQLGAATSKGETSKIVANVVDALLLATISMLVADMERYGSQAADHWCAMIPIYRAAYSDWDAAIAAAAEVSPALAALSENDNQAVHERSNSYATEAVFARLLPAWEAFVADLPDAKRAASLSAMLQQAAGTVGIAPMGESGAVVSYDPLSHHLVAEGAESPDQVRIVRPGVLVQRSDGSSRVLVAALVAAV